MHLRCMRTTCTYPTCTCTCACACAQHCTACTPCAHCTWQFAGHTSDCLCLSVAPDGPPKIFATGGLDNTVLHLLWLELYTYYGSTYYDSTTSCTVPCTISWTVPCVTPWTTPCTTHAPARVSRARCACALPMRHAQLCHLAITPQVRLWDISSGKCVRIFLAKSEVNAICKQYSVYCGSEHATCRTNRVRTQSTNS